MINRKEHLIVNLVMISKPNLNSKGVRNKKGNKFGNNHMLVEDETKRT